MTYLKETLFVPLLTIFFFLIFDFLNFFSKKKFILRSNSLFILKLNLLKNILLKYYFSIIAKMVLIISFIYISIRIINKVIHSKHILEFLNPLEFSFGLFFNIVISILFLYLYQTFKNKNSHQINLQMNKLTTVFVKLILELIILLILILIFAWLDFQYLLTPIINFFACNITTLVIGLIIYIWLHKLISKLIKNKTIGLFLKFVPIPIVLALQIIGIATPQLNNHKLTIASSIVFAIIGIITDPIKQAIIDSRIAIKNKLNLKEF